MFWQYPVPILAWEKNVLWVLFEHLHIMISKNESYSYFDWRWSWAHMYVIRQFLFVDETIIFRQNRVIVLYSLMRTMEMNNYHFRLHIFAHLITLSISLFWIINRNLRIRFRKEEKNAASYLSWRLWRLFERVHFVIFPPFDIPSFWYPPSLDRAFQREILTS